MSNTDSSHTTRLQQRRNRVVSELYRSDPSIHTGNMSQGIYLQVTTGALPIYTKTVGGADQTEVPCACLIQPTGFLRSKNNLTSGGLPVGGTVTKDMGDEDYTDEYDPMSYYPEFFPGLVEFTDANIVAGDKDVEMRLIASYWSDLGNDVFDDWGYFYIYDVESGKYYLPLIAPQNQDDGVITTQIYNAFGRTFTIKHGWSVQGIFKFDITVADNKPFRFGAYGNMGSDGDEFYEDLTYTTTIGSTDITIHYHHHEESGDNREILYSYFIPKNITENASQTYNAYYDNEDMSMVSKAVTSGLIVYFAKTNDVNTWVAADLEIDT